MRNSLQSLWPRGTLKYYPSGIPCKLRAHQTSQALQHVGGGKLIVLQINFFGFLCLLIVYPLPYLTKPPESHISYHYDIVTYQVPFLSFFPFKCNPSFYLRYQNSHTFPLFTTRTLLGYQALFLSSVVLIHQTPSISFYLRHRNTHTAPLVPFWQAHTQEMPGALVARSSLMCKGPSLGDGHWERPQHHTSTLQHHGAEVRANPRHLIASRTHPVTIRCL